MIANDSPRNHSFPFSYGTITSKNPAGIASDSPSEFCRQAALNDNPALNIKANMKTMSYCAWCCSLYLHSQEFRCAQ